MPLQPRSGPVPASFVRHVNRCGSLHGRRGEPTRQRDAGRSGRVDFTRHRDRGDRRSGPTPRPTDTPRSPVPRRPAGRTGDHRAATGATGRPTPGGSTGGRHAGADGRRIGCRPDPGPGRRYPRHRTPSSQGAGGRWAGRVRPLAGPRWRRRGRLPGPAGSPLGRATPWKWARSSGRAGSVAPVAPAGSTPAGRWSPTTGGPGNPPALVGLGPAPDVINPASPPPLMHVS